MNIKKKNARTMMESIVIFGTISLAVFFLMVCPMFHAYKKKQAITAYRLAYSNLMQANKMYSLVSSDGMNAFNTTLPVDKFVEKYFIPYLNVVSFCKDSQTNCWKTPQYKDLKNRKLFDKSTYSIRLSDRSVIGFHKNKQGLISAIVDIDGPAGINKLGKDVFVFYFYNNAFAPKLCGDEVYKNKLIINGIHYGGYDKCGIPHDVYEYPELYKKDLLDSCTKKAAFDENISLGAGAACGAVLSKTGWVMDKFYPW